jgi:hypothetical protein
MLCLGLQREIAAVTQPGRAPDGFRADAAQRGQDWARREGNHRRRGRAGSSALSAGVAGRTRPSSSRIIKTPLALRKKVFWGLRIR